MFPKYVAGSKRKTKEYSMWLNMRTRCFNNKFKTKWPTYRDCTCSTDFNCFATFAEWVRRQKGFSIDCHLDKDLLIPGNKHYSADTCVLVPPKINLVLVGRTKNRGLPQGVFFDKTRKKFTAQVHAEGSYRTIGRYDSVEEAELNYKVAKYNEIKRLAELYKDQLDTRAYNALINYPN